MPDLRRLRYLLAVAEERSFTRAAARLHVAQPALSRQVRLLEAELGVELLRRTPEGVEPTEAGDVVLRRGPGAVAAFERMWDEVREVGDGCAGTLTVAHGSAVAYDTLPRLVEHVRAALPALDVVPRLRSLQEALSDLAGGAADVALVRNAPAVDGIEAHPLRHDRQGALLDAGHPLAARASVALGDLAGLTLSLHEREEHPPHFDFVVGALREAGVELERRASPIGFDPGHSQVAAGGTVMLVGASAAPVLPRTLAFVPIEPPLRTEISLLARTDRPRVVDRVIALAGEVAERADWLESPGERGVEPA